MTGAGTAISTLGMPDLGLATADDMVRNAAMLASLDRSVPVIADADTGYGGPVMVARTVSSPPSKADLRLSATSWQALRGCTSKTR